MSHKIIIPRLSCRFLGRDFRPSQETWMVPAGTAKLLFVSKQKNIPFNKPWVTGKELEFIADAVKENKLSGDGRYTGRCHEFVRKEFGFNRALLTSSCTDALEMTALLLGFGPGDEVIMPSYTFVSTANAFMLRGATIRFADSLPDHPNMDPASVADLVNPRTKAIIPVHYAGMACDMDAIAEIASASQAIIAEDAAHALGCHYRGKNLGSIGALGTFSFHESKNISSGEGGMLVVNDERFFRRAEIIREKGTNRSEFFRGEAQLYNWMDIGSSFLPSDITAAFLYAQLLDWETINADRLRSWNMYYDQLKDLENKYPVAVPKIPVGADHNGYMFYMVCDSGRTRDALIRFLNEKGINAVFHYQALHASPYFHDKYKGRQLPNAVRYTDCLVRLPLYCGMESEDVSRVCSEVTAFFSNNS